MEKLLARVRKVVLAKLQDLESRIQQGKPVNGYQIEQLQQARWKIDCLLAQLRSSQSDRSSIRTDIMFVMIQLAEGGLYDG